MATYKQIADRVKQVDHFVQKPCWIADVESSYGLTRGPAPNRRSPDVREVPCPPKKRDAIERALRFFGMIP